MRTPGIFILGLVLAPCGWVLDLTCTVAPGWRNIHSVPGESTDLVLQQGIWDICRTFLSSREVQCNQQDTQYFENAILKVAQGFMLASLLLNIVAIGVASAGVRCWTDTPNWTIAGIGGLLIFISGVLAIIPVAWYTHSMASINSPSTDIRVGYCLVLGFIGGILEVIGGLGMSMALCRGCGSRRDGMKSSRGPPARRTSVPSVSSISTSSVPYYNSKDLDFPRGKTHMGGGHRNNAYSERPYDSDL